MTDNRPDRSSPFDAEDLLTLDRMVCFPLYAATNLIQRTYRPVLADLGLTYPQYLVMLVLWEAMPQSVGALGDRLYLDSGTLTPMLKRMEANGLVARQRDVTDERRVLISLTPAGATLRERALPVPERLMSELELSPDDLFALRDAVGDLVRALAISRPLPDTMNSAQDPERT